MCYKMDYVTDFQVDLVSNASLDSHPDNSLSSFTNELHTPLKLEGDWEVAIVEIFHPTTIEKDIDKVVNISLYRDVGGLVKTRSFPFNYKLSDKISTIVNNLNKEFDVMNVSYTADATDSFKPLKTAEKPGSSPIQLKLEKQSVTIDPGNVTNTGLFGADKVSFSPSLMIHPF